MRGESVYTGLRNLIALRYVCMFHVFLLLYTFEMLHVESPEITRSSDTVFYIVASIPNCQVEFLTFVESRLQGSDPSSLMNTSRSRDYEVKGRINMNVVMHCSGKYYSDTHTHRQAINHHSSPIF
jgi:hypothetical protein